jgi:hypothetical protein
MIERSTIYGQVSPMLWVSNVDERNHVRPSVRQSYHAYGHSVGAVFCLTVPFNRPSTRRSFPCLQRYCTYLTFRSYIRASSYFHRRRCKVPSRFPTLTYAPSRISTSTNPQAPTSTLPSPNFLPLLPDPKGCPHKLS